MAHLLLLRHAQSAWNAAGRWQGWSDAPLSELGVEQARRVGRDLASSGFTPSSVGCSDLARAYQTARLLALGCGYRGPISLDPALREQGLGQWEGLTNEEIAARWPGQLESRGSGQPAEVPGGEANATFARRALAAVGRAAGRCLSQDGLVVTHGGVVMAVERELGVWGPDRRHPNLAGWWLEVKGTAARPVLVPLERVELLVSPLVVAS